MTASDPQSLSDLANEMTGGNTSDPVEAFEQWKAEREALLEIHDENQSLVLSFRRFKLVISLASGLVSSVESECGMFISQKTREKIGQFREQLKKLEDLMTLNTLTTDHAQERASKLEIS